VQQCGVAAAELQIATVMLDEDIPGLRDQHRKRDIGILFDQFRVSKRDAGAERGSHDAQVLEDGLNRCLKRRIGQRFEIEPQQMPSNLFSPFPDWIALHSPTPSWLYSREPPVV
jgi:hypothetical protein